MGSRWQVDSSRFLLEAVHFRLRRFRRDLEDG